jgi:Putative peptidoglycan binding domain
MMPLIFCQVSGTQDATQPVLLRSNIVRIKYLRCRLRYFRVPAILLAFLFLISSFSFAKTTKATKHHSGSASAKTKSSKKKGKKAWQVKGQKTITSDRTREIQEALIREHYLSGQATGSMDNATKQALIKLQQENGWQTKVVPDSRALIRLGLGPSQSNLLNPDTAALASAVSSHRAQR